MHRIAITRLVDHLIIFSQPQIKVIELTIVVEGMVNAIRFCDGIPVIARLVVAPDTINNLCLWTDALNISDTKVACPARFDKSYARHITPGLDKPVQRGEGSVIV